MASAPQRANACMFPVTFDASKAMRGGLRYCIANRFTQSKHQFKPLHGGSCTGKCRGICVQESDRCSMLREVDGSMKRRGRRNRDEADRTIAVNTHHQLHLRGLASRTQIMASLSTEGYGQLRKVSDAPPAWEPTGDTGARFTIIIVCNYEAIIAGGWR